MPRLLALSAAGALSLVLAYLWRKRDEKARRKHDDEARRMRDGDALFTHLCAVTAPLNFGASTHTPRLDGDEAENVAMSATIYDARPVAARLSLDEHGLALRALVRGTRRCEDLYDAAHVVEREFPLVEALVLRECRGATRAIAFDHVIRNGARAAAERAAAPSRDDGNDTAPPPPPPPPVSCEQERCAADEATSADAPSTPRNRAETRRRCAEAWRRQEHSATPFLQNPLSNVHGDYTARSGLTRARQLLEPYLADAPETLDALLSQRVAIVNVWLPLSTVRANPLAMCVWSSVRPRDVRTNRLTFTHRVGETYKVAFSPRQKWVYFSELRADEAVLLKTFDSQTDGRSSRFCLHSAFPLPEQRRRAERGEPPLPARESVEVRVLVLWGKEELAVRDFVPPHMKPGAADANEGNNLLKKETLPQSDEW